MFGLNWLASRESIGRREAPIVVACFLFSLLSKETGLLLILAGLFMLWQNRRPLGVSSIAALTSIATYGYLRFAVAGLTRHSDATTQIGRASTFTRLLTVPKAITTYLVKLVYPANLTVTQDWVVSEATLAEFWTPLIALIALSVGIATYAWLRRDRWFIFFAVVAVMSLGLHSHVLIPIDGTVADRWFYLTALGLFGMIAAVLYNELKERPAAAGLATGVALAIAIAFGVRSHQRSLNWRDGYTLYSHDLAITPDSFDLQNNLGVELFRRGNIAEAKVHFERSVELAPHWTTNWNNLGAAHQRQGDIARAEAAYFKSIQNGDYLLAYENYAGILINQNKTTEAREFLQKRALLRFPGSSRLREFAGYLGLR
jgi:tetratricopeptide (TPR) repeat protein